MSDTVAGGDDPGAKRRYWPIELDARFADPQFRGQGGMGRVWAAYDKRQQRRVAVKVLREDVGQYAESLERFRAEAARMQQVPPHPNVIEIYAYGTIGDWCFLTMPLLSGPHVGQKRLTVPEVLEVVRQTAAGLAHLHVLPLVHRDVKPSNLVFDGHLVKIVDFGIAKAIDVTPITKATAGTEGYMAPELRDPRNDVTTAVDIYSLGCVLFERLTGVKPGDVTLQLGTQDRRLNIPRTLRPLLDGMLATDPAARPTATQVQNDLASFLAETAVHHSPAAAPPDPRQLERLRHPEPPPAVPERADPRTRIVPLPDVPVPNPAAVRPPREVPVPDPAAVKPQPTAVARVPVAAEPVGPLQRFVQEWLTARGQFGHESLSGKAVVMAVGAWLLICLGGGWVLSLALLLLLRMLGVG